MSTNLPLVTHPTFGSLRAILDDEAAYVRTRDAANAPEDANTRDAIKLHCEWS